MPKRPKRPGTRDRCPTLGFALAFALSLVACAGPSESTGAGAGSTSETEAADVTGVTGVANGSGEAARSAAPDGEIVDGYFTAADAPAPRACAADSDCVASGVLAADGCCWSYRDANLVPQSAAYRDWTSARRAACDVASCGPPPAPAQPADCLFEVSCDAGQCVNACR